MSENAGGGSPPGLGPRLKGPRRGRRWSFDVISPKIHLWKRSRSIEDPDHLFHLSHLSSLSHLTSGHLLNVPQTIREESHSLGFSFPWKRAQSQQEKEVYAVLDLCDGQTLVVSVCVMISLACVLPSLIMLLVGGRVSTCVWRARDSQCFSTLPGIMFICRYECVRLCD